MSAPPQIESAGATGEAAALLAQMRKSSGPIPNMAKAMANSPALLKGYMDLSGALVGGVLPAAVRERLALATAEYNRCTYSADLYRKLQKQTLNQRLRRRIVEGIPYRMALEGLTAADLAYQPRTS